MYFCNSSAEFLRRAEETQKQQQQQSLAPTSAVTSAVPAIGADAQVDDPDDILLCDLFFNFTPQSPDDCGSSSSSNAGSGGSSSSCLMSPPASTPGAASHGDNCVFSYPPQLWSQQPERQHLAEALVQTDAPACYQQSDCAAAAAAAAAPTDAELMSLTIRDLNSRLRGLPRHAVQSLKRRRRTLKNRRYAQTCRQKRHSFQLEMEKESGGLARELLALRQQLESVSREKEFYYRRCLEFEMARAKPSRLWP